MKLSKKGLTLTELIISSAFLVLLMATATVGVIMGYRALNLASVSSDTYIKSSLAESQIRLYAKNAVSLKILPPSSPAPSGYKAFAIRSGVLYTPDNSSENEIRDISIRLVSAGSRIRLDYTIIAGSSDSDYKYTLDGGVILNNITVEQLRIDGVLAAGSTSTQLISLKDNVLYLKS